METLNDCIKLGRSIDCRIASFTRMRNITQEEYAGIVGITSSTMGRKRTSESRNWKLGELCMVADSMGITVSDLLACRQ